MCRLFRVFDYFEFFVSFTRDERYENLREAEGKVRRRETRIDAGDAWSHGDAFETKWDNSDKNYAGIFSGLDHIVYTNLGRKHYGKRKKIASKWAKLYICSIDKI